MGKIVLVDAFVSVGGNDISSNVSSATLTYEADAVEKTCMGDTTHLNMGGLKNWGLEIELLDDYDAAEIDSIMFPLVGTEVACIIRPDSAVVGVDNPQYTGQGVVTSYPPIGGSVGDAAGSSISIVPAGALGRATA